MRFLANKRLIFIVCALIWFEFSILPLFSLGGIKPDLFFIFLSFYAFRIRWKHTIQLAFALGLAKDLLTNSFFGLETASYTLAAILLQFLAIRFDREKPWIQMAGLFSFSWISLILFSLFALLIQTPYGFSEWVFLNTFLISLYTTALGALLFPAFEKWLKPPLKSKQYELF